MAEEARISTVSEKGRMTILHFNGGHPVSTPSFPQAE
jgi:hypothetical protein